MAGKVASMRSHAGQASGLLCWRHRRKNWVAIESSIDKTVSAGCLNSRHNATRLRLIVMQLGCDNVSRVLLFFFQVLLP
jgi:hypothetical protein